MTKTEGRIRSLK
jgi:hypothetical protein